MPHDIASGTSRIARPPTSDLVREHVRWEYDDLPFFEGEVEPCINGSTVAIGTYFGEDMQGIVDRLLTEQMADGGWNCEQERGSTRGSFDDDQRPGRAPGVRASGWRLDRDHGGEAPR